jgi:phage/plasmid primase-like uncharacterized protein
MANIQIKCARCGGTGRFSFNLRDGTKCYGCEGAGIVTVDEKKHARSLAAAEKRRAGALAKSAARDAVASEVWSEMTAQFGPFSNDAKGAYDLVTACQRAHGKTPGQIVNERLACK